MSLKEKLHKHLCRLCEKDNDFRNITKVGANFDDSIKNYGFSKFWLISCIPPSQVALCYILERHNRQLSMERYTNFIKFHFSWTYIFHLLLCQGRWLCMHLWLNLINRTIDIQENFKIVTIYVQSQWRVWQSSVQRGQHTKLCIINSLKCIIQICSNCYCWVSNIALYLPSQHCCLGKLPL